MTVEMGTSARKTSDPDLGTVLPPGPLAGEPLASVSASLHITATEDRPAMRFKDYYAVMGVARGASQDEIKRA
jgi:hypothetical protein